VGRTAWVRTHLERLLAGQTQLVITTLEQAAEDPTHTAAHQQALRRTAAYDRRNAPSMRYNVYLARGWPIGTGIVEGACGHRVGTVWAPCGHRVGTV